MDVFKLSLKQEGNECVVTYGGRERGGKETRRRIRSRKIDSVGKKEEKEK